MTPLREKLVEVEANEAKQRRRAQANFPMTVTDFLAIRDKSHQLHVCQFLMLEDTVPDKGELTSKREPIMTKYRWVWRQVTPLCEEYSKNVSPRFHPGKPHARVTDESQDDFKNEVREIAKTLQPPVVVDERQQKV